MPNKIDKQSANIPTASPTNDGKDAAATTNARVGDLKFSADTIDQSPKRNFNPFALLGCTTRKSTAVARPAQLTVYMMEGETPRPERLSKSDGGRRDSEGSVHEIDDKDLAPIQTSETANSEIPQDNRPRTLPRVKSGWGFGSGFGFGLGILTINTKVEDEPNSPNPRETASPLPNSLTETPTPTLTPDSEAKAPVVGRKNRLSKQSSNLPGSGVLQRFSSQIMRPESIREEAPVWTQKAPFPEIEMTADMKLLDRVIGSRDTKKALKEQFDAQVTEKGAGSWGERMAFVSCGIQYADTSDEPTKAKMRQGLTKMFIGGTDEDGYTRSPLHSMDQYMSDETLKGLKVRQFDLPVAVNDASGNPSKSPLTLLQYARLEVLRSLSNVSVVMDMARAI